MNEEKRIYVVVAEAAIIHDCYYGDRTVIHPAGRLAAQCAHVVSKARVHEFMSKKAAPLTFEPITTIVLSGRNNKELNLLGGLLIEADVPMEWFFDTNPEAYYGRKSVC